MTSGENAVLDVVKALLPAIDDFERSIENVPEELEGNSWVDGTVAIGRKLQRILEQYDIEPIDPVGQPFDPDYHQGLGIDEESDLESGHVSETLQRWLQEGRQGPASRACPRSRLTRQHNLQIITPHSLVRSET